MAAEQKVSVVRISVGTALKLLQERLNETQEGMAKRVGCTFSAYSKWLRGERMPSGHWMLKILALCPDQEAWANFIVDSVDTGSKIPFISRPEAPKVEEEARRPAALDSRGRQRPKRYKPGPPGR